MTAFGFCMHISIDFVIGFCIFVGFWSVFRLCGAFLCIFFSYIGVFLVFWGCFWWGWTVKFLTLVLSSWHVKLLTY